MFVENKKKNEANNVIDRIMIYVVRLCNTIRERPLTMVMEELEKVESKCILY